MVHEWFEQKLLGDPARQQLKHRHILSEDEHLLATLDYRDHDALNKTPLARLCLVGLQAMGLV